MTDAIKVKRTGLIGYDYENKVLIVKNSESELIEQAKKDPSAFGKLYDIYYSKILNYIYHRVLDIEIAEELTSNTFYNALKAIPKYRHRSSFRAWLYRIATNEIKMFWRTSKHRRDREENFHTTQNLDRVYFITPDIEKEEEQAEKMQLFYSLHESLNALPEKYHTVLVLRYFEGLQYEEIAKVVGKRVGTVKSLVHRGLKRLRVLFNGKNATFSFRVHYYK